MFPLVNYKFIDSTKTVTNITKRTAISNKYKNDSSLYFVYDISDSDTPETLANNLYGSPDKDWIIYHMNDMINPFTAWPVNASTLFNIVSAKYDDPDGIHHYEDSDKNWVNSNAVGAIPITNYAYEDRLNDDKRKIKILLPEYAEKLEIELYTLLNT